MDETCSTCMHSKVMAGRFFCDCPAVRRIALSRVDRARNPMDTCENWDTLNEDYDGDSDGRQEEEQ